MPFLQRYKWLVLAGIGLILFVAASNLPVGKEKDGSALSIPHDRTISKSEAIQAASAWVKQRLPSGAEPLAETTVSFQANTRLSGYLQKNKLVARYADTFLFDYPVEYWQIELRPSIGRTSAYILDLDMASGRVVGWRMKASELLDAPSSRREGQRIAENYLREYAGPSESYEYVQGPDGRNPSRYVFEVPDVKIGEAVLRYELEVKGREVTAYHTSFRVPASHNAWLEKQQAASGGMSRWSLILTGLMALAAIYMLIRHRKITRFRKGLLLAAVFLGLYLMNNWNQMPAFLAMAFANMPDPFAGKAAATAFSILSGLLAVALALMTYMSLAAGNAMWQARGIRLWPKWSDASFGQETLRSMGRGYSFGVLMLGLQALMLWIAQAGFGMWAVNDPSSSYYNFYVPALFPLMAWAAAISEEAIYRLFGIALFMRIFRDPVVAVFVPSLIWAFNHTLYPIYPVYTRLIEVTLLGLLFGYALWKHGFLTALFAHAVIDSVLMSLPLIGRESGAGQSALGIAYLASPAVVGFAIWWLHKKLRRPISETDSSSPPADPPPGTVPPALPPG
ncbi:CPBP family intramembrane glutamic endopeptidase [Paenibacillus koleovorans]|uniref:CPBP family intramembrane glutamic endopeptidase n=1 Tax=Paenibacillus koleovorans TaxID=121608 RepID=UPI000FD84719|nr:type II CAAX endopeptidase family protein [Paenibacillus koleovorans]